MSDGFYSYIIGYYRNRPYTLLIRPDYSGLTDTDSVEDNYRVSIVIYFRYEGEEHEIVRIDNSHGYMHIHRFYNSQDEEREEIDLNFWKAIEYVKENWKRFAKLYDRNHL